MTFKYVNRKNLIYYLHKIENENGKVEYYMSRQKLKNDMDSLPEGAVFEIIENVQIIISNRSSSRRIGIS